MTALLDTPARLSGQQLRHALRPVAVDRPAWTLSEHEQAAMAPRADTLTFFAVTERYAELSRVAPAVGDDVQIDIPAFFADAGLADLAAIAEPQRNALIALREDGRQSTTGTVRHLRARTARLSDGTHLPIVTPRSRVTLDCPELGGLALMHASWLKLTATDSVVDRASQAYQLGRLAA